LTQNAPKNDEGVSPVKNEGNVPEHSKVELLRFKDHPVD